MNRRLCRHCNRYRAVLLSGLFRAHPAVPRAAKPWSQRCAGSGTVAPSPPLEPQQDPYRVMRLAYLDLLFSLIQRHQPRIDDGDLFDRVERTLRALEAA